MRRWTLEQEEWLRQNYSTGSNDELAAKLGYTKAAVDQKASVMRLKKGPEFWEAMRLRDNEGRFKKGQIPPNKGKKMSPETYKKVSATFFKPGHLPKNTRPCDGYITKRSDGYWYIRTRIGIWRQWHRVLWADHYGNIPRNGIIRFIDGNRDNVTIENLELITMQKNMLNNSIHKLPEDLKLTVITLKTLNRKIKKHEKRHHSSSQSDD